MSTVSPPSSRARLKRLVPYPTPVGASFTPIKQKKENKTELLVDWTVAIFEILQFR